MPRFPQLFCFAFMACASPHSTPATDTGGTTNPPPVNSNGHDWPRFGFDEARTSAFDAPTGITVAIVPTMKRQQVAIGVSARVRLLRAERGSNAPRIDENRLQHLEQAVDAIAIEIERISESQRFTTKLLAERGAQSVER